MIQGLCRKMLEKVTVVHIQHFSSCACCYMLTYSLLDSLESLVGHGSSHHEIEQYVDKNLKVHCCTANQESAFIAKIW